MTRLIHVLLATIVWMLIPVVGSGENPNEDLLLSYPKWRLQPAPFTLAKVAVGYSPEALDNAFHQASDDSTSQFFEVMDSNSDLQSLAKIADLSAINLNWEGAVPDYLLINPTFSVEAGGRLTLSAQLCQRDPFMRIKTLSASVSEDAGLEALMEQFWMKLDSPMPVLRKNARGVMEAQVEKSIGASIAEIALPGMLDTDGNLGMFSLNALSNTVTRASSHHRLIRPYYEFQPWLTSARWGRHAQNVDVLGLVESGSAGDKNAYRIKGKVTVPREMFGEGYNGSVVQLEHATFVAGREKTNYLSSCFYYLGGMGDYPLERFLVFVNYDPASGMTTSSTLETRWVLGAYGKAEADRLLEPAVRTADRPVVRLDPTGNFWTYQSPAAGGILLFENLSEEEGQFVILKKGQVPKDLEAVCHYRPQEGEKVVEHVFTPNGRAIVLVLSREEDEGGRTVEARRVVIWDFRGDRGTVVGDSRTSTAGLYNGGRPVVPLSAQTLGESQGTRLFEQVRFGNTSPQSSGGLLILGCNNADYEVWKFAVSVEPPEPTDRDRDTVVSKRYFSGSFPSAYAKKPNVCPLAIEPEMNRVFVGGTNRVEVLQLYATDAEASNEAAR
ncbi:hypothetical protein FEM03_00490 [Phragmitibacter flavus]|uniref:Uncharacterized protein n=1 Tax=Phragmitibacter flavus TaxID=2576071 RepID=A0A5R8KJT7_9BACT|nr:hypothetical protein [Phragmitibacter flavus]TLD72588.1 hypothetical protein FEM03_00490 [Phragmitibacter flavus]